MGGAVGVGLEGGGEYDDREDYAGIYDLFFVVRYNDDKISPFK